MEKAVKLFFKFTNFQGLLQGLTNLKINNITDKILFLSSTKIYVVEHNRA